MLDVTAMTRERRRRTYMVWLVLFHPSASNDLQAGWKEWTTSLDMRRRPIPADLVLNLPPDLLAFGMPFSEMRGKGWVWAGMLRWRDRRDFQQGLEAILAGMPRTHDANWIWMHIMEGPDLVYSGTAAGLDAASFAWKC